MARFSYIMTFRADLGARSANLRAVLGWLSPLSGIEVLLIEQDGTPKISVDSLPPNCSYCFVSNEGPFNKAWGLNVGFKRSSGVVLGFGDADLLLDRAALMSFYERCRSEFQAVKPYDELVDLTREESLSVLEGNCKISVNRPLGLPNRESIGEYVSFCGGLFLMQRDLYEQLGGFDERFVGWGGEDDAMTVKLHRFVQRRGVAQNQVAYHLWHERNVASRYLHPHYKQNLARAKWYAACDTQSLTLLCERDRLSMGRTNRYTRGENSV